MMIYQYCAYCRHQIAGIYREIEIVNGAHTVHATVHEDCVDRYVDFVTGPDTAYVLCSSVKYAVDYDIDDPFAI